MEKKIENIDSVFRNQLSDYTQTAPNDMWERIEGALDNQPRSKKFVFYKIAAAIAALLVLGSAYLFLVNYNQELKNSSLVVENTKEINVEEAQESTVESNIIEQSTEVNTTVDEQNIEQKVKFIAVVEKISETDIVKEGIVSNDERERFNKLEQMQIALSTDNPRMDIIDVRKQKIKSYLNSLPDIYGSYAINDLLEQEETKNDKWVIGGEFSPLYSYRHISESNGAYSKDMYDDTENPIMSYTGGLNLQYQAVDKLTVQAGVYYTTMGHSLDYMAVYSNSAYDMVAEEYRDRFITPYTIVNSAGDVSLNSKYIIEDEKSVRVNNLSNTKNNVDLSDPIYNNLNAEIQQSYEYIEVPVLLRYKLVDKNIDFNIIGGFGANFLIDNNIYVKYSGNKESIGEASGVSSVNYNGTIGFGIEYPLFDRINIRVEPSFKYYLNEINSSSSVESHPYSIGIYTGINYSF